MSTVQYRAALTGVPGWPGGDATFRRGALSGVILSSTAIIGLSFANTVGLPSLNASLLHEVLWGSYVTPAWTKVHLNPNRSTPLTYTMYLIVGDTTGPGISDGKNYFSEIQSDIAPFASGKSVLITSSIVTGVVKVLGTDTWFNDATSVDGQIMGVAIVANITNASDSPFCFVDLSSLELFADDESGIELTVGDDGFIQYTPVTE